MTSVIITIGEVRYLPSLLLSVLYIWLFVIRTYLNKGGDLPIDSSPSTRVVVPALLVALKAVQRTALTMQTLMLESVRNSVLNVLFLSSRGGHLLFYCY